MDALVKKEHVMFRAVVLVIAAAVVVAGLALAESREVQGANAACPPNPSPPNPADPSMVLNQPLAGATVTSPVQISGLARVFEAHVDIKIYSASGMVLVDTFTMSSEAAPTLAPFSADVPFTVLTAQVGCIRVFASSPADGTPREVVQVEVNLTPSASTSPTAVPTATPGPVTPPSTGDGGLTKQGAATFVPFVLTAVLLTAVVCVRLRRGGIRP